MLETTVQDTLTVSTKAKTTNRRKRENNNLTTTTTDVTTTKILKRTKSSTASKNTNTNKEDQTIQGSCPICCNHFTSVKRMPLACMFCQNEVCKECVRTSMLTKSESYCFNCKNIWPESEMNKHFPKTWVNGNLLDSQVNVIFDQQKAMMPETLMHMKKYEKQKELEYKQRELFNLENKINNLNQEIYNRQQRLQRYSSESVIESELKVIAELNQKLEKIETENANLVLELVNLSEECHNQIDLKNIQSMSCFTNGCRGYLFHLGLPSMKCDLCKESYCSYCYEKAETEHQCNIETRNTIALLKKDTKPCPKCKEMIYKISGCDQMFCTQCKTLFSWNTGQIETGFAHNPHYLEWRSKNRDSIQEADKHRIIEHLEYKQYQLDTFIHFITQQFSLSTNVEQVQAVNTLKQVQPLLQHFKHYAMTLYQHNVQNEDRFYLDIRQNYLRNGTTDESFKSRIKDHQLTKRYDILKSQILNSFVIQAFAIIKEALDYFKDLGFDFEETKTGLVKYGQVVKTNKFDISQSNINHIVELMNKVPKLIIDSNLQLLQLGHFYNKHETVQICLNMGRYEGRYEKFIKISSEAIRIAKTVDVTNITQVEPWMNDDEVNMMNILLKFKAKVNEFNLSIEQNKKNNQDVAWKNLSKSIIDWWFESEDDMLILYKFEKYDMTLLQKSKKRINVLQQIFNEVSQLLKSFITILSNNPKELRGTITYQTTVNDQPYSITSHEFSVFLIIISDFCGSRFFSYSEISRDESFNYHLFVCILFLKNKVTHERQVDHICSLLDETRYLWTDNTQTRTIISLMVDRIVSFFQSTPHGFKGWAIEPAVLESSVTPQFTSKSLDNKFILKYNFQKYWFIHGTERFKRIIRCSFFNVSNFNRHIQSIRHNMPVKQKQTRQTRRRCCRRRRISREEAQLNWVEPESEDSEVSDEDDIEEVHQPQEEEQQQLSLPRISEQLQEENPDEYVNIDIDIDKQHTEEDDHGVWKLTLDDDF